MTLREFMERVVVYTWPLSLAGKIIAAQQREIDLMEASFKGGHG